jgi:hypothetical protein
MLTEGTPAQIWASPQTYREVLALNRLFIKGKISEGPYDEDTVNESVKEKWLRMHDFGFLTYGGYPSASHANSDGEFEERGIMFFLLPTRDSDITDQSREVFRQKLIEHEKLLAIVRTEDKQESSREVEEHIETSRFRKTSSDPWEFKNPVDYYEIVGFFDEYNCQPVAQSKPWDIIVTTREFNVDFLPEELVIDLAKESGMKPVYAEPPQPKEAVEQVLRWEAGGQDLKSYAQHIDSSLEKAYDQLAKMVHPRVNSHRKAKRAYDSEYSRV